MTCSAPAWPRARPGRSRWIRPASSGESFEGPTAPLHSDTGLLASPDQFYASSDDFWTATTGAVPAIATAEETPGAPSYTGQDGIRYWAGEDLDHSDDGTDTVVLGPIPITGFTGLSFSGLFAADGVSGGLPRYDSGEGLEVAWDIDGGGFTTALAFKADGGGVEHNIRKDADLNGTGDGGEPILGSTFVSDGFPIPGTGAALTIRITGISTGSSEEFAFDNLKVTGTYTGSAGSEIAVYDGPTTGSPPLTNGQATAVDFGCTQPNVGVTRKFTVENTAVPDLILPADGLALPAGYTLNPPWPTEFRTPEIHVLVDKADAGASNDSESITVSLVTMPSILSVENVTISIPDTPPSGNNVAASQYPYIDAGDDILISPSTTQLDTTPASTSPDSWKCLPGDPPALPIQRAVTSAPYLAIRSPGAVWIPTPTAPAPSTSRVAY